MHSICLIFFILLFNFFVHALPGPQSLTKEESSADEYGENAALLTKITKKLGVFFNISTFGKTKNDEKTDKSNKGLPTKVSKKLGDFLSISTNGKAKMDEGTDKSNKIYISPLTESVQLGVRHAVSGYTLKPDRVVWMEDFNTAQITMFYGNKSRSGFAFTTYAPLAFVYIRYLYGIQSDDFIVSMCSSTLKPLSNPGKSGSKIFLTRDNKFFLKTVQNSEMDFFEKSLSKYYEHLKENPTTLLSKVFGLYAYQDKTFGNVRLQVMNNVMPLRTPIHQKYDLKGSTLKRKTLNTEGSKSPTFKDLDFMEHHPEGIFLEDNTYEELVRTIQKDCEFLASVNIMDYSLLIGVHNEDLKDGAANSEENIEAKQGAGGKEGLRRETTNKLRTAAIHAKNAKGEKLLLYMGIIDILQDYRHFKKIELALKSVVHEKKSVSVQEPGFYAQRFQDFMTQTVFKKISSQKLKLHQHLKMSKP